MKKSDILGEFEQTVLLCVLRLGEDAYGVTIRREILVCAQRDVSPGALYTTLDRLEAKGNLVSREGEATASRGGRAKRYYSATKQGRKRLADAQQAFQRLLVGVLLRKDTSWPNDACQSGS